MLLATIKRPTLSFDFKQIWNLEIDFLKRSPILNVTEIRPVGVALINAYGQTDRWTDRRTFMAKLINSFRDYSNCSWKLHIFPVLVLCDCGVSLTLTYWRILR